MFQGLSTASSNEPKYQKELFEQRLKKARNLCFQLLNTERSSVAHLEALTLLKELIHVFVWYSDYVRSMLGNVTDSDTATLSQLDYHDNQVKDIQKLKNLVLTISNHTEGQGDSDSPTTAQTLTFIDNMKKGMRVRYKRGKKNQQSTAAQTGTPASASQGSKGQNMGIQERVLQHSILKNSQSTSRQGSGIAGQRPTESQQRQQISNNSRSPGR